MRDNIITLATDLMRIRSTKGNPKGLYNVLTIAQKHLSSYRMKLYTKDGVRSLLFYNCPDIPKKFTVILNAHLDVVSAREDQFTPRMENDRLYGRGSYDMKGAAAVEILAFANTAQKINYPLGLQLVTDEEVGGFQGTKFQVDSGISSKFILVGETSSDFSLGIRAKGILWMNIRFVGKSAHGAYPWNGENALWKVHTFLNALTKKYPTPKKEAWQTTVNVAGIETSNKTYNKVPDEAVVKLDIRYIPEEGLYKTEHAVRSLIPRDATAEIVVREPAHVSDKNDPFIQCLANVASDVLRKEVKVVSKHGASDLRHYAHTAGVEFGPIGHGPHMDDEWVSIRSLESYYEILCKFLVSISDGQLV